MRALLPALALALLVAPAHAQTQAEMNMQAATAYRAAQTAMTQRYDTLHARLSPEARTLLEKSQRDWLKFARSECAFRSSGVRGGSAYPMIVSTCMQDVTQARADALQRLLTCEEGDMSCPY